MGGKTIYSIFAGRKENLDILFEYVHTLVNRGEIDEVHIWNYARRDSDREWLRKNIALKAIPPSSLFYGGPDLWNMVSKKDQETNMESAKFKITFPPKGQLYNDLSFLFATSLGKITLELGEGINQSSAILKNDRVFIRSEAFCFDPDVKEYELDICFQGTLMSISMKYIDANQAEISSTFGFDFAAARHANEIVVSGMMIKSASNETLFDWHNLNHPNPKFKLFEPFDRNRHWSSYYYHYFHHRKTLYSDVVLIKSDDDILYLDLDEFKGMIAFRKKFEKECFCMSANVINNGVTAHIQQLTNPNALPKSEVGYLSYPDAGFEGVLWASGHKAKLVHENFLKDVILPKDVRKFSSDKFYKVQTRVSINWIIFTSFHLDFFDQVVGDDERNISVTVPERYPNFKNRYIYGKFYVAHLSYFKQLQADPNWIHEIRSKYTLLSQKLNAKKE